MEESGHRGLICFKCFMALSCRASSRQSLCKERSPVRFQGTKLQTKARTTVVPSRIIVSATLWSRVPDAKAVEATAPHPPFFGKLSFGVTFQNIPTAVMFTRWFETEC